MAHILCVSTKAGKTVKVSVVNKLVTELSNTQFAWVDTAIKSGKAPNGKILKPCPFHSGYTGAKVDPLNPINCYTEGINDYGVWFDNYEVYDTCHELETASQEMRRKEITDCDRIIETSLTRHDNAIEAHSIFEKGIEKIKLLEEEITKAEKGIKDSLKPVDLNHPEYKVLLQLRDMAKKTITEQQTYQRRVYDKSPENKAISFEEFFKKNCFEIANLDKVEFKMKNWINARTPPAPTDLVTKISLNKKEIEDTKKALDKNWKIPYALIYKLKSNLQRVLNAYGRYKYTRDYTKEQIKADIIKYDSLLALYHMYIKDINPENIIAEVEKEQRQAIKNEKVIKNIKTVHKIENSSEYIPIVCLDGNVRYAADEERFIVGSTVSVDDNWRSAGNVTNSFNVSIAKEDDSKWSMVRK